MSREVRRVPLDFDWPLEKVWQGYLMPPELRAGKCGACEGSGYSPRARELHDLWYGYVPFRPEDNGSTPFTADTPAVRDVAERNVQRAPEFYGSGEAAVRREAQRLTSHWNSQWCSHVNEEDVAALLAEDRLWALTRTWSKETGWQPIDPPVVPTPDQVNEWNIRTMGHDSLNAGIVVEARCKREGAAVVCSSCEGTGEVWRDEQHQADHAAWKATEPPAGDGWQLWETVSDGSPISPVFATAGQLGGWMADPARGSRRVALDVAMRFIAVGWAPSAGQVGDGPVVSGVEFVGAQTAGGGDG